MNQHLQIFIEYKVREEDVLSYEREMNNIISILPQFGAKDIQWFTETSSVYRYVEMYEVPTHSHHYALKKLRLSKEHAVFSKIQEYIDGGFDSIEYWALKSS